MDKRHYVFHTIPPFSIKSRWHRADNVFIAVSLSFFFLGQVEKLLKYAYYIMIYCNSYIQSFSLNSFQCLFCLCLRKKKKKHTWKKTCWFNHIKLYFWLKIKSQFKCQHTKDLFKTPDRPILLWINMPKKHWANGFVHFQF